MDKLFRQFIHPHIRTLIMVFHKFGDIFPYGKIFTVCTLRTVFPNTFGKIRIHLIKGT